MNVYAEDFCADGINFRKTTILQFGNSFELIGSAILKNPGSSLPIDSLNQNETNQIKEAFPNIPIENWKKFSVDATMNCLEKIFNGYYINDQKPLSGMIQLFNLQYIREQDIYKARNLFNACNSKHKLPDYNEIISLIKDKPVYLGWFDEPKKLKLHEVENFSTQVFDYLKENNSSYLNKEFKNNKFYHPMFVNKAYKFPELNNILREFHKTKV